MPKKAQPKELDEILQHLEAHNVKLERMEKQNLKNTEKIEKLEITLGIVALALAILQVFLTFYFR